MEKTELKELQESIESLKSDVAYLNMIVLCPDFEYITDEKKSRVKSIQSRPKTCSEALKFAITCELVKLVNKVITDPSGFYEGRTLNAIVNLIENDDGGL